MAVLNIFAQGCICYIISSEKLFYSKFFKDIKEQNFFKESFWGKMQIVF